MRRRVPTTNSPRAVLIRNHTGKLEWYCSPPTQPPWLTEKHPFEAFRDRTFAATPFPESQPIVFGNASAHRYPGKTKHWTWTYIEAKKEGGLTRHFLRRDPYGTLLLKDELAGQTFRILGEDIDDALPPEPHKLWPEKPLTCPLISVHYDTELHPNGHLIHRYYVAYTHPTGAPHMPARLATTWHALRKRDGSWCWLPKSQFTVPESWQPGYKQPKPTPAKPSPAKSSSEKLSSEKSSNMKSSSEKASSTMFSGVQKTLAALTETFVEALDKFLPSTSPKQTQPTEAQKTKCGTAAPAVVKEPEEPQQKPKEENPAEDTNEPDDSSNYKLEIRNYESSQGAYMHPSNSTPNSNDHGSGWTWTAIETENNGIATRHCLRCSPQGQLLLKQELVGYTYAIVARNVDPGRSAEPTPEALEEARSVLPVQMGPNNYTVAPAEPSGLPHLPARVASTVHFLQKPDGSWCVLPKTQSAIPQSWYPKSPQRSQSQPAPPETLSPPKSTKSTKSTESIQSTKSIQSTQKPAPQEQSPAKESKVPNPDHPITRSPDHPILLDTMNALENLIQEHLVCTDHQRTVLALWILHTYTCKATYLTPYLNISSPVEESGKSTCMTILRGLCAQPWWAAGASPSGFKNKLLADHPTVLLDNWHTLFRASDKHPMTGFLLSGCHQAPNLNSGNSGDCGNFGNSFCPKAFAGMESLPPSLARHSIPIVLQRRKPQELVKSAMRLLYPQNTQKFISWMRTWAEDQARHHQISENFEKYECQTHLLPGFSPHQQDSWVSN